MKKKIFNIIQIGDKSNRISRAFDFFITIVIISNILVTFLETFEQLSFLSGFFCGMEYVTIFIFCIAYLSVGVVAIPTGIISAGFVEQYQHKSNIFDFLVLRDHLSVLPQKNMILKLNDIIVIRTQEEDSKQIIRNL